MNKRHISRILTPLLVVPLALGIASCSAGDSQACDGGNPIEEPQRAVQNLLEAAETNDYDKACSVIILPLDKEVMATHLNQLRQQAEAIEVTSSNFKMLEGEQGGSAHHYRIYSEDPEGSLDLALVSVGNGFRIAFGE